MSVTMTLTELLHKQAIFQGVDEATVIEMQRYLRIEKFQKRDFIFHQGTPGDHLILLLVGRMKMVTVNQDAREVGLGFVEGGDYSGELSIIDGQPRSSSAIAETECLVGFLPATQAKGLFYKHPVIMEHLLQKMARTIRQALQERTVLSMGSSYSRVYAILMGAANSINSQLMIIENLPTQQALAAQANVSRETVSRAIQALIEKGIVEKDNKRLLVRHPTLLMRLSRGETEIQSIKKVA